MAPSVYRDTVLADSPLSYWRLDETGGTTASDLMHTHNGTYNASPSLSQPGALVDDPDPAVSLNGSTQSVTVPYAAALNPPQFSAEVWAKPTGGAGTYRGVLASRTYPNGWVIYAGSNNTWQFWIDNGTKMSILHGSPITLNTWTHLVGTFDGTTARFYVNGVLVASSTISSYSPQTSLALVIGQSEVGTSYFFPGSVDEPAIYAVPLSASQVQNHYLVGSSSVTATPTDTAISGSSATPTSTATITPSPTPSRTPIPATPSASMTTTATPTATATSTKTATTVTQASPTFTSTAYPTSQMTPTSTPSGNTWYVSRNGNNTAGTSWTTAWNELNAIKWSSVKPGDTIVLDGGSVACASPWNSLTASPYDFASPKPGQPGSNCGMLYNTTMTVGASGTAAAPIVIKLAADVGHNGTAVLFGGRITSLPDCTQPSYSVSYSGNNLVNLINFPNRSYVTVDGTKRSGIVIYGGQYGIDLDSSSTNNIVLQNLEIFDNGIEGKGTDPNDGSPFATSGYGSDDPGIALNGSNITIARDLIHDNGQDDIADETVTSPESNITVTDSWLYFSRENVYQPGWGFNTGNNEPCHHPDGLQTWNGGTQTGLVVQNSIIGPYLGQGVYPADSGTGARWNNVTLNNLLFFNVWYDSINADCNTTSGWTITNITSYKWGPAPDGSTGAHLDCIRGTKNVLDNSIFENASNDPGLTGFSGSGSPYWNTDPVPGGTDANPLFTSVLPNGKPHWSDFQVLNLTPSCTMCANAGSSLHVLQDILTRIDSLNASGALSDLSPR
jgi:hypothetical protein